MGCSAMETMRRSWIHRRPMNRAATVRPTGKEVTLARRRRPRPAARRVRPPVIIDARTLGEADLVTLDLLARLTLELQRRGAPAVVVRGASGSLQGFIGLCGLDALLLGEGRQPSRRGGRPNIGKKRCVSRKNVIPAIRPSRRSSTWSDHGA